MMFLGTTPCIIYTSIICCIQSPHIRFVVFVTLAIAPQHGQIILMLLLFFLGAIGVVLLLPVPPPAPNKEVYLEVTQPAFGIKSFDAMLSFAKDCKTCLKEVCFSVVDEISEEEISKSQELADSLGIPLRVRVKNG